MRCSSVRGTDAGGDAGWTVPQPSLEGAAIKPIGTRVHGILDYVTVVVFALAPAVLGLSGIAAVLSYVLAVAHLVVTLATNFDLGAARLLQTAWHGWIELVVGLVLLISPWILGFSDDATARTFSS
jgi:hypothetical protein